MPIISPTAISPHRIGGKNLRSYWATQLGDVYTAMPTKPASLDLEAQGTLIKSLKDSGVFDKSLLIYVPSVHSEDSSLINWKTPGTYDLTVVNTPVWTLREGCKGVVASSSYLRTHFVPSVNHGGIISQNDIAFAIGIGTELASNSMNDFGVNDGGNRCMYLGSRNLSNQKWDALNSQAYNPVANALSVGHYICSRSAANEFKFYKNKDVDQTEAIASTGLPADEIYLCGLNNYTALGGSVNYISERNVRYFILASSLTPTEKDAIVDAFEEYFAFFFDMNLITSFRYAADGAVVDAAKFDTVNLDPTKIEMYQDDSLILRGLHAEGDGVGIFRNYYLSTTDFIDTEISFSMMRSNGSGVQVGLWHDANTNFCVRDDKFEVLFYGSSVYNVVLTDNFFGIYKIKVVGQTVSLYKWEDKWNLLGSFTTGVIPTMKFIVAAHSLNYNGIVSVRDISIIE